MSARFATRVAWGLCAVALALLALTLLLVSLGWSTPLPKGWGPWQALAITSVGIMGAPILGALIASRRPGNLYGWLWLGFGLGGILVEFAQAYAAYALVVNPDSLPLPRIVGTQVAGLGWITVIGLVPFLLLLFPTGRPPSRRWRFVVWAAAGAGIVVLLTGLFLPGRGGFAPVENPLGIGGIVGEVIVVLNVAGLLVILVVASLSVLSLAFRFWRASGVERQQIKWFAYAAVLFIGETFGQFLYEPPGTWDALIETIPLTILYTAVGVAVLRYRLYEIDRIINRTLVYGALTASLVLAYLGSVTSMQYAFRAVTGGASQLVIVASTLVIAALFNPLRRRIQDFIDWRFYRSKYDAKRVLDGFAARLREETGFDRLGEELVLVVRETVKPAYVSLWMRPPRDASRGAKRRRADE